MTDQEQARRFWTLNTVLMLILLGGFFFLLIDIRYEHRAAVSEYALAWIPILFAGSMVVIGGAALFVWNRGGRRILAILSALACLIGLMGVWFHTNGKPWNVIHVLSPWVGVVQADEETDEIEASESMESSSESGAPLLAPLSFAGLGLLGMIATSRRFPAEHAP